MSMLQHDRWLLPEGIQDVLPHEARRLENLRREFLDLFGRWGYELVMPPFVEYLDSLLVGTGHDLDLQTFKLTDQLSGRTLGVRADMTPQVARIDAHDLQRDEPTRLCYLGTVLHALNDPLERSRSPLQIGAELYGHAGIESDLEIVDLRESEVSITDLWFTFHEKRLARNLGIPIDPSLKQRVRREHPPPARFDFRMQRSDA